MYVRQGPPNGINTILPDINELDPRKNLEFNRSIPKTSKKDRDFCSVHFRMVCAQCTIWWICVFPSHSLTESEKKISIFTALKTKKNPKIYFISLRRRRCLPIPKQTSLFSFIGQTLFFSIKLFALSAYFSFISVIFGFS